MNMGVTTFDARYFFERRGLLVNRGADMARGRRRAGITAVDISLYGTVPA
jgi:hypothetical protein